MANDVVTAPRPREAIMVTDPVPVLDTARFEHMQRIAKILSASSLIPETLRREGPKNNQVDLPPEQVFANCFLVVNQAVRWGMDPFAVISCCSVVYGRLMYEGKLVAAVLEARLGVTLNYAWNNESGDRLGITVTASGPNGTLIKDANGQVKSVSGTVGEWKTTGAGTPWNGKQDRKMLSYRGAREWARLYEPGTMLGVYSDDELTDMAENARAERSRPVERLTGVVDPLGTSKPVDKPAPNAATSSGDGEIPPVKSEVKAGEADSTGASPVEKQTPPEGAGPGPSYVPLAVADGHPAPAAPEGAAKAEAKPVDTPATAPPVPATLDEYRAHVLAYVAGATSASALEARWKAKDREPGDKLGDRSIRTKLNIEKELFDELEGVVKAKCAELKGGAT